MSPWMACTLRLKNLLQQILRVNIASKQQQIIQKYLTGDLLCCTPVNRLVDSGSSARCADAGALPAQPISSGEIMQYTAEEKGKQKALNQDPYQPVADSQEARELEEGLLLSKLQASGSSTQKSLAAIDPDMPGGERPLHTHQTHLREP